MTSTLQMLLLVVWANAAPVLARLVFGHRFDWPLDGARCFLDGRPLLGASKTWRGLGAAVLTTPLLASVLGLPWLVGLVAAIAAMLGDMTASFLKRRIGRQPSDNVMFLDQLPEALMTVLAVQTSIELSAGQAAIVVLGFVLIDLVLTPLAGRVRSAACLASRRSVRKWRQP